MRSFLVLRRSDLFEEETFYFEVTFYVDGYAPGDVFGDQLFSSPDHADYWLRTHII